MANDAQILKIENGKPTFKEVRDIDGKIVAPNGTRTCMTAFISYDDGKTFPHKLLLDERADVSYPSFTQAEDGYIYIAYDRGRGNKGQHEILMAKISEDDIIAGKTVSPNSRLKAEISSPSKYGGGVRDGDKL